MSLVPNNILQNVTTFQMAELAILVNDYCAINLSNKKFKDFDNLTANLGDTVSWDLTPRYVSQTGLVVTDQPSVQRPLSMVCSQAINVSSAYTDQQFMFNVEDYMMKFGEGAIAEMGPVMEADVLRNIISGVITSDPANPGFGKPQTQSGPYRFFGDGINPINSSSQLAKALVNFRAIGFAKDSLRGILPIDIIPEIINTNANQFTIDRGNQETKDWELGSFSNCDWYQSNLLPIHNAGDIGNADSPNNLLTVVSTNDPTGVNVTEITCTEPTGSTNVNAIKSGDMGHFIDGVAGQPNMRTLTFGGHILTNQPVQFLITENAETVAGTVTITLRTATTMGLVSAQTQNQNMNNVIQPGMKIRILPSHQAGLIYSGDQLYMAMPKLPTYEPWPNSTMTDPETGVSIRHYWGSLNGENKRRYVRDAIWGSVLTPENCMRVILPLQS